MDIYRLSRRLWFLPAKTIAFILFGLGGAIFTIVLFPVLRVLIHPRERFRRILRKWVGQTFRSLAVAVQIIGLAEIKFDNFSRLARLKSSIVCANHPSLFDVVLLMGYVHDADCIINAGLWRNPFMGAIVRFLYIPNSLSVEETVKRCRDSLQQGNNLIIFPEGTRTAGETPGLFHRSAAQISLRTGRCIVPIAIAMNSARGLRKKDAFLKGPAEGIYRYRLSVLPTLHAVSDSDNISIQARSLTKELKLAIIEKLEELP